MIWPPTRAKWMNIVVAFILGSVLIGVNLIPARGELHTKLMKKKKDESMERLEKLLEEAKRAKPASAEAKVAIDLIEESLAALGGMKTRQENGEQANGHPEPTGISAREAADSITKGAHGYSKLPDGIQAWFKGCLAKGEDGIKEMVKGVVNGPHTEETKGKPEEFKAQVEALLLASDYATVVKSQFPAAGSASTGGEHEGAEGAQAAADSITKGAHGYSKLPDGIQAWFKGCLAKGEDGIKEMVKGVVNGPHTEETKGKPEEFKAQVEALLLASDYATVVKSQFPEKPTINAELLWPAEKRKWLEETLAEQDGVERAIKGLVDFHSDPKNADRGAVMSGASDELQQEVRVKLEMGTFGKLAKTMFNTSAVGDERDDNGDDEKGSEEARKISQKLTDDLLKIPSYPKFIQDWYKSNLKKDNGVQEIINGTLEHHSQDGGDRYLSGCSDELKEEVRELLTSGDFEEVLRDIVESKGSSKGPSAEKCFETLIDETEEALITFFGIPKDEPMIGEGIELLGQTVYRELGEKIAKTRYAIEHKEELQNGSKKKHEVDCGGEEPEDLPGDDLLKFVNGEELDKLIDICKKVKRHFGKVKAGADRLKLAYKLQGEIGGGKKKLLKRLLEYAMPVLPTYTIATILVVAKEFMEVPMRVMSTELIDSAILATEDAVGPLLLNKAVKIMIFFGFKEIIGITGDILKNRCTGSVQSILTIARSVFVSVHYGCVYN